MSDSDHPIPSENPPQDSTGQPSGAGGLMIWLLIPVGVFIAYLFSPFFISLGVRFGYIPPPQVIATLQVFWFPLEWYVESGLPGGEEYVKLIQWLSGEP